MSDLKLRTNVLYVPSKTIDFFCKVNRLWAIAGIFNLWIVDVYNSKIHKFIHKVITFSIVLFIILEYVAIFTQLNLTDKQSSDLVLFTFSHPIVCTYYVGFQYYKKRIRELLIMLHISLKYVYNDPLVEKRMIKKASLFALAYLVVLGMSLTFYGLDGVMQVIRGEGTFTTVITAWPDVEDESFLANVVRVINYIVWWVFILRISGVSTLTIMTSVAISHQFKNLQSYFYSLNDLFQDDADENTQKEAELKYIEALKVGIKMHSDTLWCTKESQVTCGIVYSGQIIINISILCLLMLQMVNTERTLANTFTIFFTIIAILASTGLFMLNAGDITVEAVLVPNAMYASGWQNCRGAASAKTRRLLVVAMMQGQEHVALRSFGIVEISYESFLSIVKSSYSIFSLLY